jgi:hypothetical protein
MHVTRMTILQFILLACLAIILVPAGAHLFELPAKMALPHADYMVIQRIYAGWAWFGVPIYLAMILLVLHAVLMRRNRPSFWLSLVALALIAVTQIIFWRYTFPMNSLTLNWSIPPPEFEAARRQWEYSHAINAALTFLAFASGTFAVLAARLR